jgi:hypothetical protein
MKGIDHNKKEVEGGQRKGIEPSVHYSPPDEALLPLVKKQARK